MPLPARCVSRSNFTRQGRCSATSAPDPSAWEFFNASLRTAECYIGHSPLLIPSHSFRRDAAKGGLSFEAGKPDSVCAPGGAVIVISLTACAAFRRGEMRHTRGYGTGRPAAYFALHRIGFFLPPSLLTARWALTPPFHYDRRSSGDARRLLVLCDTIRRRRMWPAAPRLEQKRIRPASLRTTEPARQRFSTGILPGGVRTFLSKFQERARRLGPHLGIKELGATIWPRS